MYDAILKIANAYQTEALRQFPLEKITSFQTGGPADLLLTPNCKEALRDIVLRCKADNVPFCVIGNGSNLLFPDEGFRGVVLRLGAPMSDMRLLEDGKIYCEAGASLTALCLFAMRHGLSGLEFAYGIPGSVGGAAYMNAGAYGGEMRDVLLSCAHIAPDGTFGTFEGEALKLGYRTSVYMNTDYVITGVTLQLKKGDPDEIRAAMDDKMRRRKEKQPLEFPSAGSTFKRPEGHFAGALIENCNLKGYSVGGAQVSVKHAGFVINTGGATTADILSLIEHIQKTVYAQTGVQLETEVRIIE